jgi:hypothetical protein
MVGITGSFLSCIKPIFAHTKRYFIANRSRRWRCEYALALGAGTIEFLMSFFAEEENEARSKNDASAGLLRLHLKNDPSLKN